MATGDPTCSYCGQRVCNCMAYSTFQPYEPSVTYAGSEHFIFKTPEPVQIPWFTIVKQPADERIASALERIADALEGRTPKFIFTLSEPNGD